MSAESKTIPTIESLAARYEDWFEQHTRENGEKFWSTKDGRPEELMQLIRDAHGDMFPDDHRYEFIWHALVAISEDGADASLEPDIYTHDLTAWLHSRADRFGYCDEALEDQGGTFPGTIELLQLGQSAEKDEVLASVLGSLFEILDAETELYD